MNDNDKTEGRRQFLKKAGTVFGLSVALPVFSGMLSSCEQDESPVEVDDNGGFKLNLNDYPALLQVGGSVMLTNVQEAPNPVIIVRNSETEFLVADSKCKHQGCTVNLPKNPGENLICPCHGAVYSSTDASVVQNPPGATIGALDKYTYTFDKDKNELSIEFTTFFA